MARVSCLAPLIWLPACSLPPQPISQPIVSPITPVNASLRTLPPPARKPVVGVYNFGDLTGQYKDTNSVQTLSRAVTQGASALLINALNDAGQRGWFTVVERAELDHLLKERQIISEMRRRYLNEEQVNPDALPPLVFAGTLIEGGIVGYDANTRTGGAGARYLGIGANAEYNEDTVFVSLRAVSVKNGEILASVATAKTIYSYGIQAGVFRFIALDELLEGEAGFTTNEPAQLAVKQAIEKSVHSLILEGVDLDLWEFANPDQGAPLMAQYRLEKYGTPAGREVLETLQARRVAEAGAGAAEAARQTAETQARAVTSAQRTVPSTASTLTESAPAAVVPRQQTATAVQPQEKAIAALPEATGNRSAEAPKTASSLAPQAAPQQSAPSAPERTVTARVASPEALTAPPPAAPTAPQTAPQRVQAVAAPFVVRKTQVAAPTASAAVSVPAITNNPANPVRPAPASQRPQAAVAPATRSTPVAVDRLATPQHPDTQTGTKRLLRKPVATPPPQAAVLERNQATGTSSAVAELVHPALASATEQRPTQRRPVQAQATTPADSAPVLMDGSPAGVPVTASTSRPVPQQPTSRAIDHETAIGIAAKPVVQAVSAQPLSARVAPPEVSVPASERAALVQPVVTANKTATAVNPTVSTPTPGTAKKR